MKKIILLLSILFVNSEIFSQSQYGWIQKAGFPGPARHRASGAAVGNRGYMGLGHINSVNDILYDDWFEYDPGTDSWTQKANYPGGPRYHAASFVINNIIYVGTGRDINAVLHQDFWKYNPATNSWAAVAIFPGSARRGAISFVLNGLGYVGTGSGSSSFFRYDPATDSWTQVLSLPGTGRTSAVGFAINGKGYITTGDMGGPLNDIWEYNPSNNTWTQRANLPGLARMEAGGFALNGKGFVGTGDDFSSGTNYQDFWCYDPVSNSWTQVTDFGGSARRYLTSFVIGNKAYAGLGTSGINYADFWEYGSISDVEEISGIQANIFPVPSNENVTISLSSSITNGKIQITDLNGALVRRIENLSGNSFVIERGELSAGIYFIQLEEKGKIITNQKLIFN
jgi:N-acetylneuraminic acid mutarotase